MSKLHSGAFAQLECVLFLFGYGLFIWVWSFHLGMVFSFGYGLFIWVYSLFILGIDSNARLNLTLQSDWTATIVAGAQVYDASDTWPPSRV